MTNSTNRQIEIFDIIWKPDQELPDEVVMDWEGSDSEDIDDDISQYLEDLTDVRVGWFEWRWKDAQRSLEVE